jgi:hypothetical protein
MTQPLGNFNKRRGSLRSFTDVIIGLKSDRVCQSILRKHVLSKIGDTWSDLPIKSINSWLDVLDEGITKGGTNWQLYGSNEF